MNKRTYPADILRAVADVAERHELDGDFGSISPRCGEASVMLYEPPDRSAIARLLRWASALNVATIDVQRGPNHYHLTINSTLQGDIPLRAVVITREVETEALHDAAITGVLTVDQLARFIREPEAVTDEDR